MEEMLLDQSREVKTMRGHIEMVVIKIYLYESDYGDTYDDTTLDSLVGLSSTLLP